MRRPSFATMDNQSYEQVKAFGIGKTKRNWSLKGFHSYLLKIFCSNLIVIVQLRL